MGLFKKIFGFDKPHTSSKSKVYRDIDKTKNINNSRKQETINKLANIFNIYGGSRLPENPRELVRQ